LIFADGLSSRDAVTEAAGRGVGMGAVRSAILELGGSVAIESESGKGTVIELRLPRSRDAA
jgi:chemotaxis protein histidine kinase CheA